MANNGRFDATFAQPHSIDTVLINGKMTVEHEEQSNVNKPAYSQSKDRKANSTSTNSLERRLSLVEKIDKAASSEVTLNRGTLWIIGTALILASLAFQYIGGIASMSRENEQQTQAIQALKEQSLDTKLKLQRIEEMLQAIQVAEARKVGYELKAAEGKHQTQDR